MEEGYSLISAIIKVDLVNVQHYSSELMKKYIIFEEDSLIVERMDLKSNALALNQRKVNKYLKK